MSTNPFRRSSLKDPGGSTSRAISDPHGTTSSTAPLSLDTRGPSSSRKHVNFASPPAIPISPISYPPSPESTRYSPAVNATSPVLPAPTDYSGALHSDPFAAESPDGSNNAIEAASQNAKANSEMTAPATAREQAKENAVKDTLNRFASAPGRSLTGPGVDAKHEHIGSLKPAIDVDAFKRLLLTGNTSSGGQKGDGAGGLQHQLGAATSDASSSADTASISQHSLFEPLAAPMDDSPRSSFESDSLEASRHRHAVGSGIAQEARKKPPPPKTRRGKAVRDSAGMGGDSISVPTTNNILAIADHQLVLDGGTTDPTNLGLVLPNQTASAVGVTTGEQQTRKPPAPPLARRQSQNQGSKPGLLKSTSSPYSLPSGPGEPTSPSSASSRPPPPPPSRRGTTGATRRGSVDTMSIPEEPDTVVTNAGLTPPASRRPSATKRMSQGSLGQPPPLPPPRRNRGSSKSSMESPRPSLAGLGMGESAASSGGNTSITTSERNVSGNSAADDILADLAALQREVDQARSKGHNQ